MELSNSTIRTSIGLLPANSMTENLIAIALLLLAFLIASIAHADESQFMVESASPESALNKPITIYISDLSKWSDQTHQLNSSILYLDGRAMKGITPKIDATHNILTFSLSHTEESKDAWAAILGNPNTFHRSVPITVGFSDGFVLPSKATTTFTIIRQGFEFWFSLALFSLATTLFLWLTVKSNILRDSGQKPDNGARKPFSLGRTQMAFWFFLVLASYLLIWIITGDRDTLTPTALILIGISGGTALGAVVVDASKSAAANSDLQAQNQEQGSLTLRVEQLQTIAAIPNASDDAKREFAEKTARLAQLAESIQKLSITAVPAHSEGFFQDILTDVGGISLHRFQIVVWTVVLGVIFWSSVYKTLSMPEFSNTLLALMGISNGTYIGFKFPEQQT